MCSTALPEKDLVRAAKEIPITPDSLERQRRSFVFGNTALDNSSITREIIDFEAAKLQGT